MTTYDEIGDFKTGTSQLRPAASGQVENNAGGYTFQLDKVGRLRRFLILGTSAGSYYASPRKATEDAAQVVMNMSAAGDMRLIEQIREVSLEGLAPKQEPTLLALAIACASPDDKLRAAALDSVVDVCRTFTMLATFCNFVQNQRGWGRGLRKAVARFYESKTADQIGYQFIKYGQRNGWTHRDVLRKTHPGFTTQDHRVAYDVICGRIDGSVQHLQQVRAAAQIADPTLSVDQVAAKIADHNLPWEAVPDHLINEPAVLEALFPSMGATALIRQLPRFARAGLTDGSFGGQEIARRLTDQEFLVKGRVHPYQVLVAARTYSKGEGRGGRDWTPASTIVDALETCFDLSFKSIVPSGKRTGLFVDVSGSMDMYMIANSPLTARDGASAMMMATLRSEPYAMAAAFTNGLTRLDVRPSDRLSDVLHKTSRLPFGGTDCAQPMLWALNHEPTLETFIVYTDNETWAGRIHPHQALQQYRQKTGINARLIVVGMTATEFTIADPSDAGMMDVVGFDSSAPRIMAEFASGKL